MSETERPTWLPPDDLVPRWEARITALLSISPRPLTAEEERYLAEARRQRRALVDEVPSAPIERSKR